MAELKFVSGVVQAAYLTRGDKKVFLIGERHQELKEQECPHGVPFGYWLLEMANAARKEDQKMYVLTEEFLEIFLQHGSVETTIDRPGAARSEVKRVYKAFQTQGLQTPFELRLIDVRPLELPALAHSQSIPEIQAVFSQERIEKEMKNLIKQVQDAPDLDEIDREDLLSYIQLIPARFVTRIATAQAQGVLSLLISTELIDTYGVMRLLKKNHDRNVVVVGSTHIWHFIDILTKHLRNPFSTPTIFPYGSTKFSLTTSFAWEKLFPCTLLPTNWNVSDTPPAASTLQKEHRWFLKNQEGFLNNELKVTATPYTWISPPEETQLHPEGTMFCTESSRCLDIENWQKPRLYLYDKRTRGPNQRFRVSKGMVYPKQGVPRVLTAHGYMKPDEAKDVLYATLITPELSSPKPFTVGFAPIASGDTTVVAQPQTPMAYVVSELGFLKKQNNKLGWNRVEAYPWRKLKSGQNWKLCTDGSCLDIWNPKEPSLKLYPSTQSLNQQFTFEDGFLTPAFQPPVYNPIQQEKPKNIVVNPSCCSLFF